MKNTATVRIRFFRVFRFNHRSANELPSIALLRQRLEDALSNIQIEDESIADTKAYKLNDLQTIPEQPTIVEGNFRFLQRLDYINEKQIAVSTYRTIYGFFWICIADGYTIIHPQRDNAIGFVKDAIEQALHIKLMTIRITMEFKNTLSFIDPATIRSGSFYDPDPKSQNFQHFSFRDESPYDKGLHTVQKAYPEAPIARYKDSIDDDKETSIVVSSKGVLGVYGRHSATLFRRWALKCLQEIILRMNEFQNRIDEYVDTLDLQQIPEFHRLNSTQRKSMKHVIMAVLSFQSISDIRNFRLTASPLKIAEVFGNLVQVQIPFRCQTPGCSDNGHFQCPRCFRSALLVANGNPITLQCTKHRVRAKRWESMFPLSGTCANTHQYELTASDVEETIEIFFGPKLLQIIENVVRQHFKDFALNFEQNVLYISGYHILYQPNKRKVIGADGVTYLKQTNIHGDQIKTGDLKDIDSVDIGSNSSSSSHDKNEVQ